MNLPRGGLVGEQGRDDAVQGHVLQHPDLVVVLHELEVAVEDPAPGDGQRRDGVTVRVVELRRLNDERHRLKKICVRNIGRDVDVPGVTVQLEVLGLVAVAAEGVKDRRAQAQVFVEGFQFLRLHHQHPALGVSLRQQGVVPLEEEGRVLVVGILDVDGEESLVLARRNTLEK